MAGLENLFAAEPTLPNVQTTKMPDNPVEWAEVLTTRIREQYPDASKLALSVEFRKKEEQSGTAVGAIHVSAEDSKNKFHVPFVVKKFQLSPMDIWMEEKTQAVHPLDNDTFKEQFFAQAPGTRLDDTGVQGAVGEGRFMDQSSGLPSPPIGKYASSKYPILDSIAGTVKKAHADQMKESIRQNPYVIPRFQKRGHAEELKKLLNRDHYSDRDLVKEASEHIPYAAVSLRKEASGKYTAVAMRDQVYELSTSAPMDRDAAADFIRSLTKEVDRIMGEVDQHGERLVVAPATPKGSVFLYGDIKDKPVQANEFGVYAVRDRNGNSVRGVVLPTVYGLDGKKMNLKLFMSGANSSMQDQIAGVRVDDRSVFENALKPQPVRIGQTGSFLLIIPGKVFATEPVTVRAVQEYGPITAVKLDGTKVRINRWGSKLEKDNAPTSSGKSGGLDIEMAYASGKNEYTVPNRMMWVPMGGFREVSSSSREFIEKVASHQTELDPLVVRWTGIVYDVSGSGMNKQAFEERTLKVVLAAKGASPERADEIVKQARATGRSRVHGLKKLAQKDQIVKTAQSRYHQLEELCASLRQDLTKVASEIDDSTTVDALLSLNFINPENLSKFISYRPLFEKISDLLAELVLATRLGLRDVSEAAASTALSKIQEVVMGLKKVESGLKRPGARIG